MRVCLFIHMANTKCVYNKAMTTNDLQKAKSNGSPGIDSDLGRKDDCQWPMFSPPPDCRIALAGVKTSEEVIAEIAKQTDTVLLAFSGGKDAIATWLNLKGHFKRIIPFYRYLVPDLRFVEESLAYYEEYFQTPIVRVPAPSLYRMLNALVFQPPHHIPIIEGAELPNFEYRELNGMICEDHGVPEDTWVASGVRASDSIQRRRHFKLNGPLTYSERTFYPIWDWKKGYLLERFIAEGVKMPVDYQLFGRSFDGLRLTYLAPIRRYYPDDYERIREMFPMVEVEFKRYEYSKRQIPAV